MYFYTVFVFCNLVSLLAVLGVKRHNYALLRTDPSLVDKSDKRYITRFNKVFSVTDCAKLQLNVGNTVFLLKSL